MAAVWKSTPFFFWPKLHSRILRWINVRNCVPRKYYTIYVGNPRSVFLFFIILHRFWCPLSFLIAYRLHSEDWASKRVGFAQADHSQDGEAQGAIGSPEARRTAVGDGATDCGRPFLSPGGLPGCRSTFEQERPWDPWGFREMSLCKCLLYSCDSLSKHGRRIL